MMTEVHMLSTGSSNGLRGVFAACADCIEAFSYIWDGSPEWVALTPLQQLERIEDFSFVRAQINAAVDVIICPPAGLAYRKTDVFNKIYCLTH